MAILLLALTYFLIAWRLLWVGGQQGGQDGGCDREEARDAKLRE
jgi:hypothetical protein